MQMLACGFKDGGRTAPQEQELGVKTERHSQF